jgi:hypothetical protein
MSETNIVRFGAYRGHEEIRKDASNAIMGLLVGAGVAAHLLQLTDGSDQLLPVIFPNIPHVRRLNLTSSRTREILADVDKHLGAMAVPYALAFHEDYLKTCLNLLARAGYKLGLAADGHKLFQQHEAIEKATGKTLNRTSLEQMHMLRVMRNCQIHSGGRADDRLMSLQKGWSDEANEGWLNISDSSPRDLTRNDVIIFGPGEIFIALAATKVLARQVNQFLQPALPRWLWADLVLEDIQEPGLAKTSHPEIRRKANGYARFNYGPMGLTDDEIAAAVDRFIAI